MRRSRFHQTHDSETLGSFLRHQQLLRLSVVLVSVGAQHSPLNGSLGNQNAGQARTQSLIPCKERHGRLFTLWTLPFLWDLVDSSQVGQTRGASPPHSCADVRCVNTCVPAHTRFYEACEVRPRCAHTPLHLADRRQRRSGCLEKTLQLSINTKASATSTPVPEREHPSPAPLIHLLLWGHIHICPAHGSLSSPINKKKKSFFLTWSGWEHKTRKQ